MKFRDNYAFLSNFYPTPLLYRGVVWPSAEHAYQSAKLVVPAQREILLTLPAKQIKRWIKQQTIQPNWLALREQVMEEVVRIKFQNPKLRAMLCKIDEPIIEENWWGDTFWGVCDGQGQNKLGCILTKIRDEIINDQRDKR